MTEWIECKLSDIGEIVGGATPSTKDDSNYDGDIAWLTPKDLSTFTERYIKKGERSITEKGYKSCSTKILPANSVLFSSRAPIGYVAIAANEMCTNQGFKSIIPNEKVDYVFLYYVLKYKKSAIEGMGSGTTFKEVSGNVMKNIEVRIPKEKSVQKKIAEILDKIDSKIENNNAINRNLLEQIQAFFSRLYLGATERGNFKSLIQVLGGGTPKTGNESFWNGHIPFFTPKDVGSPYTFETEKTITEDGLAHCNSKLYPTNTTFVTARGTVGKVALAGVPMAMNQSCYALVSDFLPELMVYFYTLEVVKSLKNKASGAVFDAIVTRDFDTEVINVLGREDQTTFLKVAEPVFEEIHKNTIENQRLQSLRDSLLPKLMSGELDVSDLDI